MPHGGYKPDTSHAEHVNLKRLIALVIFLLFLYVVLPQFHDFRSSFDIISHAKPLWILAAISATGLSYPISSLTIIYLAKHKLSYLRTMFIKLAGSFTNRLLPAGAGAMGISYDFLRKNKHTPTQSIAVVAANNVIGLIGHLILLAATLLIAHKPITQLFHFNFKIPSYWVIIVCAVILVIVVVWFKLAGKNFYQNFSQILKNLSSYRTHPLRLIGALITSILLTLASVLCLMACLDAINIHLSFIKILIVLTLGIAGGTAVPTPGGLGGAEAGLIAGFIACGLKSSPALAVTLLYRLITYWLTLIIGAVAFSAARRLKYI
jgi:uncharacterized membrane protein YbhN (UPF0104 family)